MIARLAITIATVLLASAAPVWAQQGPVSLRIAGWNMESGESDDSLLRRQLAEKSEVDIWGLSEVRDQGAVAEFEKGAEDGEGANFDTLLGTTGNQDRLAIIYNADRFELVGQDELRDIQPSSGQRAPLVAHLRGEQTGQEFKFMVNHLARGDAAARLEQAKKLNLWARSQNEPVISVGDYNFDYHVNFGDGGDRDEGFDALLLDGAFIWVKPEKLVKTQADDSFMSVLDFVFVANPPSGWTGVSTIFERDGDSPATEVDFPDDRSQTDHRPVDAVFAFKPEAAPDDEIGDDDGQQSVADREEILRRLDELERSLRELRELVGPG